MHSQSASELVSEVDLQTCGSNLFIVFSAESSLVLSARFPEEWVLWQHAQVFHDWMKPDLMLTHPRLSVIK